MTMVIENNPFNNLKQWRVLVPPATAIPPPTPPPDPASPGPTSGPPGDPQETPYPSASWRAASACITSRVDGYRLR